MKKQNDLTKLHQVLDEATRLKAQLKQIIALQQFGKNEAQRRDSIAYTPG